VKDILKLDWDNIDFLINCIADQIQHKRIKFDSIIALGRGGLIPGAALSYKLGVLDLQNLGISTREDNGKYIDTLIYQKPQEVNKKYNILVVDDINDSGRTFTAVKSLLKSQYDIDDKNVYFASLIKRNGTEFVESNTISGNTVYSTSWLQFPWDK
jgi:hypoxanthine phosphoribosyltransferase